MASRQDILARFPGVMPIALTESEAAAMCGMPRPYFREHCDVVGVRRGQVTLYPSEDVSAWFRRWWLAQSGQSDNTPGKEDWTKRFEDDDKDAA